MNKLRRRAFGDTPGVYAITDGYRADVTNTDAVFNSLYSDIMKAQSSPGGIPLANLLGEYSGFILRWKAYETSVLNSHVVFSDPNDVLNSFKDQYAQFRDRAKALGVNPTVDLPASSTTNITSTIKFVGIVALVFAGVYVFAKVWPTVEPRLKPAKREFA